MDISNILTISRKSELHKYITQIKNGFIVENLKEKRRFPVYNFRKQKISFLKDIKIFCKDSDIQLENVFKNILNKLKGEYIDIPKNIEELKEHFIQFLPNFDENRVGNHDIKEIYKWYNALVEAKIIKNELSDNTKEKSVTKEKDIKLKSKTEYVKEKSDSKNL